MQVVVVKQIQLENLKTEQITQLVQEVDLVKRLSHPNIIEYEGVVRDSLTNTLSVVVECVFIWIRRVFILTCCVKACSIRVARADTRGIRQAKRRETGGELCDSGPQGSRLPPPQRHRALQPQGSEHSHDPKWGSEAFGLWHFVLPA